MASAATSSTTTTTSTMPPLTKRASPSSSSVTSTTTTKKTPSSSHPFLLIPAHPHPPSPHRRHLSLASNPPPPLVLPSLKPSFNAPAAPSSKSLHSIPPRHSSTRSLILSQTAEMMTQMRVGSVRAERGIGSVQAVGGECEGRRRGEFWEGYLREDDEDDDDEEEEEEEEMCRMARRVPNTTLAQTLHSKARGVTSVLCATLAQPHPTSSHHHSHSSTYHPLPHHQEGRHRLPEEVRVKLWIALLAELALSPLSSSSSAVQQQQIEIPTALAPFVSLSSYKPASAFSPTVPTASSQQQRLPSILSLTSPTSSSSTSSKDRLPPIKTFMSSSTSSPASSSTPKSAFASFGPSASSAAKGPPAFFGAAGGTPPATTPKEKKQVTGFTPIEKKDEREGYFSKAPTTPTSTSLNSPAPIPKSMTTNWTGSSSSIMKPSTSSSAASQSAMWSTTIPDIISSTLCSLCLKKACPCISSSSQVQGKSLIGAGLDQLQLSSFLLSSSSPSSPSTLTTLSVFLRLSACLLGSGNGKRPSKKWYALLAVIISRAVLEGYMKCGWRGVKGGEVLFGVGGRGIPSTGSSTNPMVLKKPVEKEMMDVDSSDGESSSDEEEESPNSKFTTTNSKEFEPSSLPPLSSVLSLLFRSPSSSSDELKFFREEMKSRRDTFFASQLTQSLSSHLTSLNEKKGWERERFEWMMIGFLEDVNGKGKGKWFVEEKRMSVPPMSPGKRARSRSLDEENVKEAKR